MDVGKVKIALREKLKDSKILDDPSINVWLEEMIYNATLMNEAKKNIVLEGIIVDVSADGRGSMQKNQAISVYDSALKNFMAISRRIGLSPRDAKEIGIVIKEKDAFAEIFGGE